MSGLNIYSGISELITLKGAAKKQARQPVEKDLGLVKNASLVTYKGSVIWTGPSAKLTKAILAPYGGIKNSNEIKLSSGTVMPSFIESHTHLVFAGERKNEFELRNQGVSYGEIAKAGGGILSTVKATRKASQKDLKSAAQKRVNEFVSQGVTTLEIKSGYALNLKDELKMLEVAKSLKGPHIVKTFLGAHALPSNFKTYDAYIDFLLQKVLPKVAQSQLAERVDIFIDEGYFQKSHGEKLFKAAQSFGLGLTMHADQMKLTKAYDLAIKYNAHSVDHLVQIKKMDIKKLAQSSLTCNLLPGADFYLKMPYPPARALIDAGARVSLATDFNPGSCPTQDLSFIGVLARLEMKMSLAEVITAYTLGAAFALNLQNQKGSLTTGKDADFILIDGSYKDLFYQVGHHPVVGSWLKNKKLIK